MHETIPLSRSTQFVVLTGAGISAESGIATFRGDATSATGRDGNGLWEQHAVEDVASPEGWERDAALVWRFYSERRAKAAEAKPNAGHLALARVQKHLGANFTLVTQNVDNLHEQAGSTNVIHMHGELFKTRCENPDCKLVPFEDRRLYTDANALPRCSLCRARLRPHIVWFGEIPLELHPIKRKVEDCDLFMTVGSSGVVYPAAGFVRELVYRRQMGESCRAIYVGLERPANADQFQETRLGKSGEILPTLFTLGA